MHEWKKADEFFEVNTNGDVRNIAMSGERNLQAKLSTSKVRRIRELYANGKTLERIATMFGVNHTAISKVVRRERWTHVR